VEPSDPDLGGRPGIAVLPFAHLGDDPAQEYLADAITEALITALTRFRWFAVAGRNASQVFKLRQVERPAMAAELGVRDVVEGSVRRSGPRVRISTRLVDAASGRCLWAEQHDLADADLFDVQDAIVERVAGAIEPELLKTAGSVAARRGAGSVTAWDLVARGCWHFHHVTQPTHRQARDLFRQARCIDPEMTEPHLWLGRVDAGLVAYGWSDDPTRDLDEGHAAALQAVELDEKNPYAHYALAIVSNYRDAFALALRSAEKAMELSPSFALGHLVHGMAALYAGQAGCAIQSLRRGLSLNRYDPQNFVWYHVLAVACLCVDAAEDALRCATTALQVRPSWSPAMRTLAAAHAALGQRDASRQWRRQWEDAPPVADALQPLWRCQPDWAGKIARLLAG
jgi:TolB-like protein